jgi:hypothetical protein
LIQTTNGNVDFDSGSAMTIGISGISVSGNIDLDSSTSINSAGVLVGNLVDLSATASIDVNTDARILAAATVTGNINIEEQNDVQIAGAGMVVSNDGNITLTAGGTIDADTLNGSITANGSSNDNVTIDVTNGNALLHNVTAADRVMVNVDGQIVTSGNVGITAINAVLNAGTGIDVDTAVNNISAVNRDQGNVAITETNGLTIGINGVGIISSGAGNVDVVISEGGLTISEAVSANGVGNINLTANDNVTVNAIIDSTEGAATITANSDGSGADTLSVNAAIHAADGATLTANGVASTIAINANPDNIRGALVIGNAGSEIGDIDIAADIYARDGITIHEAVNNIELVSDDVLNSLTTNNANITINDTVVSRQHVVVGQVTITTIPGLLLNAGTAQIVLERIGGISSATNPGNLIANASLLTFSGDITIGNNVVLSGLASSQIGGNVDFSGVSHVQAAVNGLTVTATNGDIDLASNTAIGGNYLDTANVGDDLTLTAGNTGDVYLDQVGRKGYCR